MNWEWIVDNTDYIAKLLWQNTYLGLLPVALGLALAVPLGVFAMRFPRLYPPMLALSGVLYTIPSLALFVMMPVVIGTKILDPLNIVIALTIYTVALLVRTVVDGLRSVPDHVRQSATALGYRRLGRLLAVELPVALPVIMAGVRVATVANISLVSVAALIGVGGLGVLFTSGFQLADYTRLVVGMVLIVALAILADAILVRIQRVLTPWARAREA